MAEAITKHLFGHVIYADSVGVREGETDEFMVAVLEEIGIDASRHNPKTFDDLSDTSFDLLITLTPEAHHRALELTRTWASEVEYWPTMDPTAVRRTREMRLGAYRQIRDELMKRIRSRFDVLPPPTT